MRAMAAKIDVIRLLCNSLRGFNAREHIVARIKAHSDDAVDATLGGLGFVLAGLALLFAGKMIQEPHEPYIPGIEYLAIFSMPNSSALKAAHQLQSIKFSPPAPPYVVDSAPTASIPKQGGRQRQEEKETLEPATSYTILSATEGLAWLQRGFNITEVRKGDYVTGLGIIASIEQKAGRWRIIWENSDRTPVAALRQVSHQRALDKPLIFETSGGRSRQSAP